MQNDNPKITPRIVPKNPIKKPFKIKILKSWDFEIPNTLNTPISFFLLETRIISEEIKLNAATIIITLMMRGIIFSWSSTHAKIFPYRELMVSW